MRYFDHQKQYHPLRNILVSLGFFLIVFFLCILGLNQISSRSSEEEIASLTSAIQKGVAHCYAVEGRYPESLTYLKETYGISYNSEKYFVDYQILGENIMPEITIIKK